MRGAVLALLSAIPFAVTFFGALGRVGARQLLRMGGALELSQEQAPVPHATTLELAHLAGIARPRLYVWPACYPPAAAIRDVPASAIVVAEPVFAGFTETELRGLLALLVAALALPDPERRRPNPERWVEIDHRAAMLAGVSGVVAALKAIGRYADDVEGTSSFRSLRSRLLRIAAATNGGVASVLSVKPTMNERVQSLGVAKADAGDARVGRKDRRSP